MTKSNYNQEAPKSKRCMIHKKKKLKRISKKNKIKIEFSSFQISEQKTKKNENNESNNNIINTIEDYEKYYEKNIDNTFKNSASRIMQNLIKKDVKNTQINNIEKIIDLKERISLINYLFNLIDMNQLETEIYFLTIYIFDSFLQHSEVKIDNREGAKLLMTSLYIALKFESVDYISSDWISCFTFKEYQFTPLELEEEEKLIYDKIGLVFCNNCIIDYFNICLVDYKFNYNNYFKNLNHDNDNNSKICLKLEKFFLNMLKLLPLDFDLFYLNKNFELIIVCIIYSFDLLRNNVNNVNNEFSVFHEWVLTFIKSMNYDIKNIKIIYKQMETFYNNMKINIFELWENSKSQLDNI